MSFFDSTAAGKTINRFSQDLLLIDTELPYNLIGAVNQFLAAIGNFSIIIYGSPWAGLAVPVVSVAVYVLQDVYLPASRQLRLLEIEAKAPLFSHFLETLNGLATIRALRWTADYARRNQDAVKISQKPFYLLFASQNWLNLVLDLITAGLAVAIMCVGVATSGSQASTTIGLALFSAAGFGASTKDVIQHWTQLEISMSAIERVRAFTKETPSEESPSSKAAAAGDSKAWHGRGSIAFDNVSARYTCVCIVDCFNSWETIFADDTCLFTDRLRRLSSATSRSKFSRASDMRSVAEPEGTCSARRASLEVLGSCRC